MKIDQHKIFENTTQKEGAVPSMPLIGERMQAVLQQTEAVFRAETWLLYLFAGV